MVTNTKSKKIDAETAVFSDICRDEIVKEITNLAAIIGSITGYAVKNILVEVSRLTRDQLANESIKPDFGHFRVQIFKYLLRYSDLAEQKSRLLSPILIDLYRNEISHSRLPHFQNFLKCKDMSEDVSEDAMDEGSQELVDLNSLPAKFKLSKSNDAAAALVALLAVFAKFHSPITVYRGAELMEIYYELLLSTNSKFQRGALACILTYKQSFLLEYSHHLMNMMDEKKLSDTLVLFTVDEQNCVVAENHRTELMPYVMRILYGRFYAKSLTRGKLKRMAIFRFLASCQPQELDIFIELVFDFFINTFALRQKNIIDIATSVSNDYQPTNTYPLYKIRSFLGIVNDIFIKMVPSLSNEQINLLFAINLICAQLVNLGLTYVDKLSPTIANLLKAIRMSSFRTFIQFFRSFQHRQLDTSHINCLFTMVLEPMIRDYNMRLSKSSAESDYIVQMSAANLFAFWSEVPRFFSLLNFSFSSNLREESPISLLCNTLLNGGTPKAIRIKITNAILNLLKSDDEDYDAQDELTGEMVFGKIAQKPLAEHPQAKGFGTRLLLPHIEKIVQFLFVTIPQTANEKSKIPYTYLDILNRISIFVENEEMGEKFALTFFSYLSNRRLTKNRERMAELFNTLNTLSKHISDPLHALRRVARFLSKLNDRTVRDALVKFILSLQSNAKFPQALVECLNILAELEAYNKNRIEEPDLERRFKAFEHLQKLYDRNDETIKEEMVQLFVHSHAYSLINYSDIALRRTASSALRRLIKYVARRFSASAAEYLLHAHIVPLALDGLNSSDENCRNEFVFLLTDLIGRFPQNPHFKQLQPLNRAWFLDANNENEIGAVNIMESDGTKDENEWNFFKNSTHIQTHRRQRAFYWLTDQLNSGKISISADLLLRYVLPIIKPYLLETISKTSALSDQSIELFAAILKCASWRKYYQILESYIRQIEDAEKTKGVVRVLIAILGAFHFDVKNTVFPTKPNKLERFDELDKEINVTLNDEQLETVQPDVEDVEMDDQTSDRKESSFNEELKGKILEYMINKVLPRLRHALSTTVNQHHKKSTQNNFDVDEQLLVRAPIVLAMSKVIKQLPDWVLKEYLHGLIAALNRLLLSRSAKVRSGARKIMGQLVQVLGSEHLAFVIKELREIFVKGFQLHVMIFTVHTTVAALEDELKAGDLDACFEDIFEICKLELESDLSDEKKNRLGSSVPEAKSNKSIETFIYLGRYISAKSMNLAVQKVKETIDELPKSSVIKKFSERLRGFSTGLHNNSGIDLNVLIEFVFGVLQQYLSEMITQQESAKSAETLERERIKKGYRPQHCLLLAPEPKRIGELVKHSIKSKVSVFVEFALQLLADVLKDRVVTKEQDNSDDDDNIGVRPALNESDRQFLELLNKFVSPIVDCLKLKFAKIVALSLRCLTIMLRYKLSNIRSNVQTIIDRLFVILSEYVGIGNAGKNATIFELNQLLFKCFTQLFRDFPILTIVPRRTELLLNYAESDVLDSQKQATSFSLIKAIIARKIEDEKVENIVRYLAELSITSTAMHVRTQCRHVVLMYLSSHPSGIKNTEYWLEFFANQTEYEFDFGRISALEMLHSLFECCDAKVVSQLSLFVFMKLCSRLVNDESEECRRYVSLTLRKLLAVIDESAFNDLFSVANDWINSEKDSIKLLALKAFDNFAHAQQNCANKNIANISEKLYEIAEMLVGNFATSGINVFDDSAEEIIITTFEYLVSFGEHNWSKLIDIFGNIADEIGRLFEVLNEALRYVLSVDIQISASKFLDRFLTLPTSKTTEKSLFQFNAVDVLKAYFPRGLLGLCFTLISQLRNAEAHSTLLIEQVVKNLSIIMPKMNDGDFNRICIKLAGICYREIRKDPDCMIKRQSVFKVIAACVMRADEVKMESLCSKLLPIIYREMNQKSPKNTDELCQLSSEVAAFYRSRLGEKNFSTQLVKCQRDAIKRRDERRKKLKALAVLDPAAEALRKQRCHERKRTTKKRKLDEMRPHRVFKRRRREMEAEL